MRAVATPIQAEITKGPSLSPGQKREERKAPRGIEKTRPGKNKPNPRRIGRTQLERQSIGSSQPQEINLAPRAIAQQPMRRIARSTGIAIFKGLLRGS